MNDAQVESLLRQAPPLLPPAGLKARLLADLRLPEIGRAAHSSPRISLAPTFWRRWFPALSFGALLLGCFIVVAWQATQWSTLRSENQSLRVALPDLEQLRSEQSALKTRLAALASAGLTTGDQEELSRLREEVSQLAARAKESASLRAENQKLQAEMAAALAKAGLEPEPDPFAEQQSHAQRINCVSNMKQIGLALRMWANDNKDVFPMDFLSASNEMNTPKILTCTGDAGRVRANSWQEFNGSSVSYEFLAPGGNEMDPQQVLTRCPVHNNVGLCDGSVQMLSTNQTVERIDGKYRIVAKPTP